MSSRLIQLITRTYHGVRKTHYVAALLARQEIARLRAEERERNPARLTCFGFQAFSQNDEDGILQEIFRRIGSGLRTFVEIGCGDGRENNTVYLLQTGWSGAWLDADEGNITNVRRLHGEAIAGGRLRVQLATVTAESADTLLSAVAGENELALLSLDIDGNDYWIWDAVHAIRPRVVVIEYNATFRPPARLVQTYQPAAAWDGTSYYGASLSALEALGRLKDYALVGCDLSGNNAFFVRKDLLTDGFAGPFTAEEHYQPPRYDLFALTKEPERWIWGAHPPGFGSYVE